MTSWLFFGDDWGAHPSTTQHLARAVPGGEQVAWVDSLTMRSLRFELREVGVVARRLRARFQARRAPTSRQGRVPDARLTPRMVPIHTPLGVEVNRALLARPLSSLVSSLGEPPVIVVANPMAARFITHLPRRALVYLRLDDYARLPGVDPQLVDEVEPALMAAADVVAAPSTRLLPTSARRSVHVPQGVDGVHFGRVPLTPPGGRVIGFFGLLAPWLDEALIVAAARALPTWTFEFVGPAAGDTRPAFVDAAPNIVWKGAVPYADLPEAIAGWDAAWIPFKVDELTRAVNPVKLREYLAAGLPTFSTRLPEAAAIPGVHLGDDAFDVQAFARAVQGDDVEARRTRRAAMEAESWGARLKVLRAALAL